jgi:glycosyltransferase involved in cell wall biosynthesis
MLVAPFAPSGTLTHGGAHAVLTLVGALAERHELVVLHLDREADADSEVVARCLHVERLPTPEREGWQRRLTDAAALARGRTLWAADSAIPKLQRRVRALVERFDPQVVQVEHAVLGDALAAVAASRLRILTIHDPAAAAVPGSAPSRTLAVLQRIDALTAVRHERRVLGLADGAVVFTERDRAALRGPWSALGHGAGSLVTIPLAWPVPDRPLDPVGRTPTLLFVGSFRHPPNVEAALRLGRRIFPIVRAACPEASLEIVGPSPPREVAALASPAVRVTGQVPDVGPHLDAAGIVVVPLDRGGGMRVKVLEALAAGKAVVATSRAAEGIPASRDRLLVVADSDQEIARAVVRLLSDDAERRALAARGRAWAARALAPARMADRYEVLYGSLDRARRTGLGGS